MSIMSPEESETKLQAQVLNFDSMKQDFILLVYFLRFKYAYQLVLSVYFIDYYSRRIYLQYLSCFMMAFVHIDITYFLSNLNTSFFHYWVQAFSIFVLKIDLFRDIQYHCHLFFILCPLKFDIYIPMYYLYVGNITV